jgi:hypothetical protein
VTAQIGELEALRWLKDSAAAEPELPTDVEAQLWARVSHDVSVLAVGCAGAVTTLDNSASLVSGTWRRVVASRLALWSAPALVVGAAAGVAGHAAFSPEKVRTVYVDRVVQARAADVPVVKLESLPLEPEDTSASITQLPAHGEKAASSASAEPHAESALTRERAVLDPARTALAAGEPAKALDQVNRHARQFPSGILSEEREAIAINALVSLGSYAQATKRAAAFRVHYPESLMTHSVDAAIAAVPKQ